MTRGEQIIRENLDLKIYELRCKQKEFQEMVSTDIEDDLFESNAIQELVKISKLKSEIYTLNLCLRVKDK